MTNPVYIVDIFGDIINRVKNDVLNTIQTNEANALGRTLINTIDYQFGHILELIQTLSQKDKSPTSRVLKYPLIWLITDFTEVRGQQPGVYAELPAQLAIIHQTKDLYKAMDREMKVFRPVLYPIYYSLMDHIADHPSILQGSPDLVPHRKTNHYFLGSDRITIQGKNTGTGNTLADYVDAIEIDRMQLKFNYNTCPELVINS